MVGMPSCYLRRPAFLWLVSYLGLLFLLREWGTLQEPGGRESRRPAGVAGAVREAALEAFEQRLEPAQAALLGGVVFGDRGRLSHDLAAAFRDAGATHLLVASGSNVVFALGLAAGFAALVGASHRVILIAGVAGAASYTACAGADAPLLRGFLMAAFTTLGYFCTRNSGAFQGLVLACWVLALADPASVFGAGFQLSFAAAFGLVAASPRWRPRREWPWYVRYVMGIFLSSLAAQIAVAPFIALHFGQFSLAALLSNIFLVPTAAALMWSGTALALLQNIAPSIGWLAGLPTALLLRFFEALARFFASLPGLRWEVAPPGPLFLGVYYAVVARLWLRCRASSIMPTN